MTRRFLFQMLAAAAAAPRAIAASLKPRPRPAPTVTVLFSDTRGVFHPVEARPLLDGTPFFIADRELKIESWSMYGPAANGDVCINNVPIMSGNLNGTLNPGDRLEVRILPPPPLSGSWKDGLYTFGPITYSQE